MLLGPYSGAKPMACLARTVFNVHDKQLMGGTSFVDVHQVLVRGILMLPCTRQMQVETCNGPKDLVEVVTTKVGMSVSLATMPMPCVGIP